ncbi:4-phosphopantetheinyl transferase family protein [Chitinophaga sp. G-6-1-13]|uniref:4-phosphopantetheinyl transferase family protein n=1 Tax=Chitinophaga fulva TaxID=2728842 RepID=A0A848GV27_9BACT|nr:4'-phosphopantetheinyl transferase superfamily protein [Chitinophaga fulva]NML41967.1 4-phosphopantetheinyl transferase family protein [Chitinophaga fulva]
MIGNDVIDLELAAVESNWRRRGYLDKLFSPAEQQLIGQAADLDRMVWLLWSAKEAAYKIIHRDTRQRVYAPLKYEVQLSDADTGFIRYGDREFPFRTVVSGSCLHTVAVASAHRWTQVVYQLQPAEALQQDEDGVPFIRDTGSVRPASVSHHGAYREVVSLKI